MLLDPIELELDKPRKLYLNTRAMMRAEKEINRQRAAAVHERVAIDYLMFKAATNQVSGSGSFPLDLLAVLLWSGLLAVDQAFCEKRGLGKEWINEPVTIDQVLDMIDASPLTRGKILTPIWDHYNEVTKKKKEEPLPNGADEGGDDPLAPRPGSSTGALQ